MTAPRWVLIDIAMAVQKQRGDMEDVHDLVSLWVRIHGDLVADGDHHCYEPRSACVQRADGHRERWASRRCERRRFRSPRVRERRA